MEHTLTMPKERAALERLHRARCIVTSIASGLEEAGTAEATDAAGALAAAAELIMQGMSAFDTALVMPDLPESPKSSPDSLGRRPAGKK